MKVGFISLGCSKNLVDSEKIMGMLKANGHELVGSPAKAEAIIINTCGFITSAKEEAISTIFEMAKYKEGSKNYNQAMADLEALQAAHQEYSEQLLENVTDLETLRQEIDEWNDTIREMEIDLRETIHDAILDREEKNRRM